jgi:predicted cation transporter
MVHAEVEVARFNSGYKIHDFAGVAVVTILRTFLFGMIALAGCVIVTAALLAAAATETWITAMRKLKHWVRGKSLAK